MRVWYLSHMLQIIWATVRENLSLGFANNKGADQPAHPCSLVEKKKEKIIFNYVLLSGGLPIILKKTPLAPRTLNLRDSTV